MLTDQQELQLAVGEVTIAWAQIDNNLCYLFAAAACGNISEEDQKIASAALFTITAIENRIQIVSKTLEARLAATPKLPPFAKRKLTKLWEAIVEKLMKQKKIRNTVAHGEITTVKCRGKNKGKTKLVVAAQTLNFAKRTRFPGYDSTQIKHSASIVRALHSAMRVYLSRVVVAFDDQTELGQAIVDIEKTIRRAGP